MDDNTSSHDMKLDKASGILICRRCGKGPVGAKRGICEVGAEVAAPAAAVPEGLTEPFCLLCDKSGHHTDKCWSTHGMNDARNREIFRLCHKRPASDDAKAAQRYRCNKCNS